MDADDTVLTVVEPEDPALARRVRALLWSYERGQLRHRVLDQPIRRRDARPGGPPTDDRRPLSPSLILA